jgi:hypothetical protein
MFPGLVSMQSFMVMAICLTMNQHGDQAMRPARLASMGAP